MAEITMTNTGAGEVGPIIAAKWDMVLDAATMAAAAADPAAADQIPARLCWLRMQIFLLCAEPSTSHADVLKKYCTTTFVFSTKARVCNSRRRWSRHLSMRTSIASG